MKKEGTLKKVLAILIIILLCLVSFGGIYKKDKGTFKNILPEYVLGMDLDSNTLLKLDVEKTEDEKASDNQEETANSENGQAENEQNNDNTEKKEEQKENKYTKENYKKTKSIIEKRLKLSGIEQYTLRLDEETGSIVIEFPEKVNTGFIAYSLTKGEVQFNVKDNTETTENKDNQQADNAVITQEQVDKENENNSSEENKEENKNVTGLIGDNKSIKKVTITPKNMEYVKLGGAYIEMKIEFTNDAIKKFKEIKNNYVIPKDSEGVEKENTVTLSMDGMNIYSRTESVFLEAATNGSILIDSNYAADAENLAELEKTFNGAKAVLETEQLPLTYNANYQNKIHSNISNIGIISVFGVILAVMLVYLLIKFKVNGLFAELGIVGFGALLLLVIRWTNVQISVPSIVSIAGMLILQFIYLINVLKDSSSKWFNNKTIEFTKMLIPAFILGIFAAVLPALKDVGIIPGNTFDFASFGMVVFWGLIIFEIYNNIISRAIFTKAKNK